MALSYDWITIKQDNGDFELPPVSSFNVANVDKLKGYLTFNQVTGDTLSAGLCPFRATGSYDTSINITIRGSQIRLDGNVSRFGRLDNIQGITCIDALVKSANDILKSLHPDLPLFTKATKFLFLQEKNDEGVLKKITDGAIIERLDICSNSEVGQYNVDDYLRSLSMLPYRNLKPHLYENGKTVAWFKNQDIQKASTHIFAKCYDKAHDIKVNSLPKAKRLFGENSKEYKYLSCLMAYCNLFGVARHELEFKSKFLQKHGFRYYGLFDQNDLKKYLIDFIELDKKAGGNAMSYETLTEKLVSSGACPSFRSAATTMQYYDAWRANRQYPSYSKISFDRHRAKLRKVGIDIAIKYDQSKVVDLFVKESRLITRRPMQLPDFYQHHNSQQLKIVNARA